LEALGQVYSNSILLPVLGTLLTLGVLILSDPHEAFLGELPEILVCMGVMGFAAQLFTRKLGIGLGKSVGWSVLIAVLFALNAPLLMGVVGWVLIQRMAVRGMGDYGIQARFWGGVRLSEIRERVEELR